MDTDATPGLNTAKEVANHTGKEVFSNTAGHPVAYKYTIESPAMQVKAPNLASGEDRLSEKYLWFFADDCGMMDIIKKEGSSHEKAHP